MADAWAYVSVKVDGDDVPSALKEARAQAIEKLGAKNVELYERTWSAGELCTVWRLSLPDPPPNAS